MSTQPTTGRIVHYLSYGTPGGEYGQECRAAIVTADVDQRGFASLAVFNPTGTFFNSDVAHDEEKKQGGTWHWPCAAREDNQ